MNTQHQTLTMIRTISQGGNVRGSRSYADFLASRIVQAATEPTMLRFAERLSALLDSSAQFYDREEVAVFIQSVNNPDASAVLQWIRQFPRVAAMLSTLKKEIWEQTLPTITLDGVAATSGKDSVAAVPSYDVPITALCLSPLSHGGDTKAGNATLFRRMQALGENGEALSLPYYSGNAVRGQMRDLLADHFLTALGFAPSRTTPPVALWFFYTLYSGGMLGEESGAAIKEIGKELGDNGAVKAEGMHRFRDLLPALSLLGCALGNRIIQGRIQVGDLRPECYQWRNGDRDAAELFDWQFLTRREDKDNADDYTGMIATTECLRVGVTMHGGIDIDNHANDLERSALALGLNLLKQRGILGADSRRGFGKVEISDRVAPITQDAYVTHLIDKADEIRAYLAMIGAC